MKEEKILFQFENMPMIVVCKNDNEERFLFLCTDPIWDTTWMITKIPTNMLINLIENKISVLDSFRTSGNPIYITKNEGIYCRKYNFSDIPQDELPKEDFKLGDSSLEKYLEFLKGKLKE